MPKFTVLCGILLIALGVLGYTGTSSSSAAPDEAAAAVVEGETSEDSGSKAASVTALIPAFLGAPLLLLGLLAMKDSMRKHAMHGAAVLSLLGFLAGAGRGSMGIGKFLDDDPSLNQRSFLFVWLMAVICAVHLFGCIQSFRAARKARELGA